jgi:hypothetical protein
MLAPFWDLFHKIIIIQDVLFHLIESDKRNTKQRLWVCSFIFLWFKMHIPRQWKKKEYDILPGVDFLCTSSIYGFLLPLWYIQTLLQRCHICLTCVCVLAVQFASSLLQKLVGNIMNCRTLCQKIYTRKRTIGQTQNDYSSLNKYTRLHVPQHERNVGIYQHR